MSGEQPGVVVRAQGLAQRFGPRTIFQDVSFTVAEREVFAILGASGSGKSSLMRQLIGLYRPNAGAIEVLGYNMQRERSRVLPHIGVMFQSGALFGSMTLLENVMLPLQMYTRLNPQARERVARTKLGLVGLTAAAGLLPAEISGGMAKRAGIARAMALDPPLLFLDEPGAGLDPVTSAGLDKLILELRDALGLTFIVVTHELSSIMAIADRCIMLDRDAQGLIAEGRPEWLKDENTNPVVHAFFHREVL